MGPVSGDVAWAFEWSASLAAGGELNISKDKGLSVTLIPEPSALAFIALGIGALGLSLRRKSGLRTEFTSCTVWQIKAGH